MFVLSPSAILLKMKTEFQRKKKGIIKFQRNPKWSSYCSGARKPCSFFQLNGYGLCISCLSQSRKSDQRAQRPLDSIRCLKVTVGVYGHIKQQISCKVLRVPLSLCSFSFIYYREVPTDRYTNNMLEFSL